ncbi:hypothetical protein SDC9_41250 [bioreactor metagenome]|uniref:Uncharacterized protein n=1 Tax=bioreactor metagenome TaxID=1076179 RepID=A0A644VUZ0_9ZZZZ
MKLKMIASHKANARKGIVVRIGDNSKSEDAHMLHSFRVSVDSAVKKQLQDGVPVARYDVKKRKVYVEYPDGKIEYR